MGTARFGRFLKTHIWTQDRLGEILYARISAPVVTPPVNAIAIQ
jgi:hypothetical protein